jgi:hypothetical protein
VRGIEEQREERARTVAIKGRRTYAANILAKPSKAPTATKTSGPVVAAQQRPIKPQVVRKAKTRDTARELSLGLIPIYGSVRSIKAASKEWGTMSAWRQLATIGELGLSVGADVFLVGGGVRVVSQITRGGRIMMGSQVPTGAEAAELAKTSRLTGLRTESGKLVKPKLNVLFRDVEPSEVRGFFSNLTDADAKYINAIRFEQPATREGALKVLELDDAARTSAAKHLSTKSQKKLSKSIDTTLDVERPLTSSAVNEIATLLKTAGTNRVTIKQAPTVPYSAAELREAEAKLLKEFPLAGAPTATVKKLAEAERNSRGVNATDATAKAGKSLSKAVREAGIKVDDDVVKTTKRPSTMKIDQKQRQIIIDKDPPATGAPASGELGGQFGPRPGGVMTATGQRRAAVVTEVQTRAGKVPIIVAPGAITMHLGNLSEADFDVPTIEPTGTPAPTITPDKPREDPTRPADKPQAGQPWINWPFDEPTPQEPRDEPTPQPTPEPTPEPTRTKEVEPSDEPRDEPTPQPTPEPTPEPTTTKEVEPGDERAAEPTIRDTTGEPLAVRGTGTATTSLPASLFKTRTSSTRGQAVAAKITVKRRTYAKPAAPPLPLPYVTPLGKLPRGQYPKVVSWPQGKVRVRYDLSTSSAVFNARKAPQTVTPQQGFRIDSTMKRRPNPQSMDLGLFRVDVGLNNLKFFKRRGKL